jgi:transcriptional regulator with XRE-family HTH domain
MTDLAAQFGDNLARCRKQADLSQEELSHLASLHRTEISHLERGLRLCRIDTLVKIRDALEVSADELLDGIVWRVGNYRPGQFAAKDEE